MSPVPVSHPKVAIALQYRMTYCVYYVYEPPENYFFYFFYALNLHVYICRISGCTS